MFKRIVSSILVVCTVLSMSCVAFAAEATAEIPIIELNELPVTDGGTEIPVIQLSELPVADGGMEIPISDLFDEGTIPNADDCIIYNPEAMRELAWCIIYIYTFYSLAISESI